MEDKGISSNIWPRAQANKLYIYVYLKLPVGTDVEYTDSVTHTLETKVYHL